MSTKIKVEMKPVNTILTRLGVNPDGDTQRFVTSTINKRIKRYMPYRTGALTNVKYIKSSTEIEVLADYARYMYYGKVMVDPVTGAAGFLNQDGKWKSRKGVPKVLSNRPINYSTHKNPLAGPFWDKRLMAAEGSQIAQDVQDYVNRKAGGR